jgi:lipid A ethanolaminephosphotransferase
VPFVYWADQEHQQAKLDCLNNISTEPMSHDNLFDILLSEMKVDSVTYSNSNNPFSKCNIENSTPNSVTIVQGEI